MRERALTDLVKGDGRWGGIVDPEDLSLGTFDFKLRIRSSLYRKELTMMMPGGLDFLRSRASPWLNSYNWSCFRTVA